MLSPLPCQQPDEDELAKVEESDPYTGGDARLLEAAGIVGYGPFPLVDHHGTDAVQKVLGRRVLWLETAHFKIGCSLASTTVPTVQEQRRHLTEELQRLKRKLPRVNPRTRTLDPWLRALLYAQRAEELYADFQRRLGVTDADFGKGATPPDGPYLGLPDKFVLLLFQKQGDLARFLERYCNVRNDVSWRSYFLQTYQLGMMVAADGFDEAKADDLAVWTHVTHGLVHNLVNGYRGYTYEMPVWFNEGLAHWYSRQIPTDFINVKVRDDDIVDEKEQHNWARKVRARASFDHYPRTAEVLGWRVHEDLSYLGHLMAWSRVDYLMSLGDSGFATFVKEMKSIPVPRDGIGVRPEQVDLLQRKLLVEVWGLDPDTFDQRWKAWVLKTYPRR